MQRLIVSTVAATTVMASSYGQKAAAQALPFQFGISKGDLLTERVDGDYSTYIALPKLLTFFGSKANYVRQSSDGLIELFEGPSYLGDVCVYCTYIDTTGGGINQNQLWLRSGNNATDLNVARNIIAGNGTLFNPQAVIVATWYKVEASGGCPGIQNTFQLAMAFSETEETWAIFGYTQLDFYASDLVAANIEYYDSNFLNGENFFTIDSDDAKSALLNGTNCNRTGVYVHRINKGGPTSAPTKAPTVAPTKTPTLAPTRKACGLLGWSIFCPFTLCGILGRWLGFCQAI